MAETTINTEIGEVHQLLKSELTQRKYRIVSEESSTRISMIQGSLWGTSAKTAQKTITYTLRETPQGTCITSKSSLTKNYISFTLAGVIFSTALIAVCAWIALDLQGGTQGMWSWLAQTNGNLNLEKAELLARISWILVIFLAATLAVEGIIIASIHSKIDTLAEETMHSLQKTKTHP